jgi:tetratricopeptide (TPR) repeat protein
MTLTLGLGYASLRTVIGLAGVAYSLCNADFGADVSVRNELLKAIIGETVGGATYDLLKGGSASALGELASSLQQGDDRNLNHDLQRAARKAQLTTTLLAARACLAETKRMIRKEKSLWSKAAGKLRKDEDEKWLNELTVSLQEKIDRLPKEFTPGIVEHDEIIGLFDPKLNLQPTDIQKQLVAKLKEDALAEIRHEFAKHTSDVTSINLTAHTPVNNAAYKLLEEAINTGWNEFEEDASDLTLLSLSKSFYRPEQKQTLINTDKQYDWFSLVCGLFNEEYKTDGRVQAAMQKYLLLDIRDRQTGVALDPKTIADLLAGHLAQFGDSFTRLEKLLETIDAKQDEILGFVKNQLEDLANRIDEVKQTVIVESGKVQRGVVETRDEIIEYQREMNAAYSERQTATDERIEEVNRNVKRLAATDNLKQRIDRNPVPNPLPGADDVFDRKDECARLKELLEAEDTRLVTILAPSGYGKTKLVAKFLQGIAPNGKLRADAPVNGVLFISCRESGTGRVWSDVFDKAGLMIGKRKEFADIFKRDLREQISYMFAALNEAGSFWIVLDNFEDLLNKDLTIGSDQSDAVRNLLHQAFELNTSQRFVITTQRTPVFVGRNPPVLREEHHIHVGGTPEDDAVRHLQEEGARFMLGDVGENILRDFVRRVDCLPLAVVSLIRHLDKYFKRKPKGGVTFADVEQEINASGAYIETDKENGLRNWLTAQIIELAVDEKLVLSVLSVFREPCPKDALGFMLPNYSDDEIDEILARLERDRLLYQEGKGFQLSAIMRECVYDLIPETATNESNDFNQTALHTRAADFYASIRKPEEQWKATEDFAPQFEEMYHCRQAELYDRAAIVLDSEAEGFLIRAGYSLRTVEKRKDLVGKPMGKRSKAYNSGCLANAYLRLGERRTAIKYYNETLEAFRQLKDKKSEGKVLGNIGLAYSGLGEKQNAFEYYESALKIHREVGNRVDESRVLSNIGGAYTDLGEKQKALEYFKDALKIHREVNDRVGEGIVLGNIGLMYSDLGKQRKALEYYKQALAVHQEVGNRVDEGRVLGNKGGAYSALGEKWKALEYYEQALQIHREVGNRVDEGGVLGNKGMTKFELGEKEEGIRLVEQALEISRQVEDKRFEDFWLKKT